MTTNYLFRIGGCLFILNVSTSKLGYAFPHLLMHFPDNSCSNMNLITGYTKNISAETFTNQMTYNINKLQEFDEVLETAAKVGLDKQAFNDLLDAICDIAFQSMKTPS